MSFYHRHLDMLGECNKGAAHGRENPTELARAVLRMTRSHASLFALCLQSWDVAGWMRYELGTDSEGL